MSGRVVVEVDGRTLLTSGDGVAVIREQALREIQLRHRYDDVEAGIVNDDPLFHRSCETAYLRIRDAASRREWREGKLTDRGKVPSAVPYRWRVPIRYNRPHTRGRLERERKGEGD